MRKTRPALVVADWQSATCTQHAHRVIHVSRVLNIIWIHVYVRSKAVRETLVIICKRTLLLLLLLLLYRIPRAVVRFAHNITRAPSMYVFYKWTQIGRGEISRNFQHAPIFDNRDRVPDLAFVESPLLLETLHRALHGRVVCLLENFAAFSFLTSVTTPHVMVSDCLSACRRVLSRF